MSSFFIRYLVRISKAGEILDIAIAIAIAIGEAMIKRSPKIFEYPLSYS